MLNMQGNSPKLHKQLFNTCETVVLDNSVVYNCIETISERVM